MKKIVRFFYFVGLLFWGSFLVHSLFNIALYNGFGDFFEYNIPNDIEVDLQRDSSLVYISYIYNVDGEQYQGDFKSTVNYFDSFGIDTVVVKYNKKIPSYSAVNGLLISNIRTERIIIIVSLIFIGIQTLFYKLAIRKKNLKRFGVD